MAEPPLFPFFLAVISLFHYYNLVFENAIVVLHTNVIMYNVTASIDFSNKPIVVCQRDAIQLIYEKPAVEGRTESTQELSCMESQ